MYVRFHVFRACGMGPVFPTPLGRGVSLTQYGGAQNNQGSLWNQWKRRSKSQYGFLICSLKCYTLFYEKGIFTCHFAPFCDKAVVIIRKEMLFIMKKKNSDLSSSILPLCPPPTLSAFQKNYINKKQTNKTHLKKKIKEQKCFYA